MKCSLLCGGVQLAAMEYTALSVVRTVQLDATSFGSLSHIP